MYAPHHPSDKSEIRTHKPSRMATLVVEVTFIDYGKTKLLETAKHENVAPLGRCSSLLFVKSEVSYQYKIIKYRNIVA